MVASFFDALAWWIVEPLQDGCMVLHMAFGNGGRRLVVASRQGPINCVNSCIRQGKTLCVAPSWRSSSCLRTTCGGQNSTGGNRRNQNPIFRIAVACEVMKSTSLTESRFRANALPIAICASLLNSRGARSAARSCIDSGSASSKS